MEERLLNEDDRKREMRKRVERYLDSGYGACDLEKAFIASIVEQSLLYFDNQRYRLLSWVVMPNHVHALLEIRLSYSLSQILGSWKSFTSHEIGKLNCHTGQFWQPDYFDRFIRDEEHYQRVVTYIENNPVKAGLCDVPEAWLYGSARFNLRS